MDIWGLFPSDSTHLMVGRALIAAVPVSHELEPCVVVQPLLS